MNLCYGTMVLMSLIVGIVLVLVAEVLVLILVLVREVLVLVLVLEATVLETSLVLSPLAPDILQPRLSPSSPNTPSPPFLFLSFSFLTNYK